MKEQDKICTPTNILMHLLGGTANRIVASTIIESRGGSRSSVQAISYLSALLAMIDYDIKIFEIRNTTTIIIRPPPILSTSNIMQDIELALISADYAFHEMNYDIEIILEVDGRVSM